MAKINVCIDIGNTSTKAMVFKNGKMDAYIKPFGLEDFNQLAKEEDVSILVSRSGRNETLEFMLSKNNYLSHHTKLPIRLDYDTPHTLGSDRIAAAVGAHFIDPRATWLIVDLGTCLTLDILNKDVFLGGLISPGIEMRFRSMNEFTVGLPKASPDYSKKYPGKSTLESLQVGVCQSISMEVEGYIRLLNKQYDNLKIMDCSGRTLNFEKDVKNEIFARPKLVLEGLNHIIEFNAQK